MHPISPILILGAKVKALIRRSKSFSQENNQQISCGPFLCVAQIERCDVDCEA